MVLFKYLKASKDGLPDPKDSLSSAIPTQATAEANREVKQLLPHANGRKRGPYKRYVYPCKSILKPGARQPASAWFLKIDPVRIVSMCVCVYVCVRTRG